MSCIANTYLLTYVRVHINTFPKRTSSHTFPHLHAYLCTYLQLINFLHFCLDLQLAFWFYSMIFFLLILNSCLHIWAQTLLERIAQCLQIHFHIYIHACNSHLRKCFFMLNHSSLDIYSFPQCAYLISFACIFSFTKLIEYPSSDFTSAKQKKYEVVQSTFTRYSR